MRNKKQVTLLSSFILCTSMLGGCVAASVSEPIQSADPGRVSSVSAASAKAASEFDWKSQDYTTYDVGSGSINIEHSGIYELTGTQTDGSVTVNVDKTTDTGTVYLILNGVTIGSSTSAPIYIMEAEQVVLIREDDTVNTITQGSNIATDESDDPSSAIFSKADLTISGDGTLVVETEFNDGIISKDDLIIEGGSIQVTAVGDGVEGKDLLEITSAEITVQAGKDGIRSTNSSEADKGNITLSDAALNITAGDDGIHAENTVTVDSTDIKILGSNEGLEGAFIAINSGNIDITSDDDGINVSSQSGTLTVNGGTITINSGGDGLDSNGHIVQNGGDIIINTQSVGQGNTPVDYDGTFTNNGGTITDQDGNVISHQQGGRGGQGGTQGQMRPQDGKKEAGAPIEPGSRSGEPLKRGEESTDGSEGI